MRKRVQALCLLENVKTEKEMMKINEVPSLILSVRWSLQSDVKPLQVVDVPCVGSCCPLGVRQVERAWSPYGLRRVWFLPLWL